MKILVLDVPIKLLVLVLGIVKTVHEYCNWILLRTHQKLVLVLGIVKASLEVLGIGIGLKKVVLLMSGLHRFALCVAFKPNDWCLLIGCW